MDDPSLFYENPIVRQITPQSLKNIWIPKSGYSFKPLTLFTFQLEHRFTGLNPHYSHGINLVLHIANTLFVFWILFLW